MSANLARPVVLVVEDSDEDYDTLQRAVERAGVSIELRRALTGGAALAFIGGEIAALPALVLMDLNTPEIDGRDALAVIKEDPDLKSIPVLVVTTSANPRDIEFCYGAGANTYHVKPVRYPDHVALVADVLTYWLDRAVLSGRGAGYAR